MFRPWANRPFILPGRGTGRHYFFNDIWRPVEVPKTITIRVWSQDLDGDYYMEGTHSCPLPHPANAPDVTWVLNYEKLGPGPTAFRYLTPGSDFVEFRCENPLEPLTDGDLPYRWTFSSSGYGFLLGFSVRSLFSNQPPLCPFPCMLYDSWGEGTEKQFVSASIKLA